ELNGLLKVSSSNEVVSALYFENSEQIKRLGVIFILRLNGPDRSSSFRKFLHLKVSRSQVNQILQVGWIASSRLFHGFNRLAQITETDIELAHLRMSLIGIRTTVYRCLVNLQSPLVLSQPRVADCQVLENQRVG